MKRYLKKVKGNVGSMSVFILLLTCFLIFSGKALLAEIVYEGVTSQVERG